MQQKTNCIAYHQLWTYNGNMTTDNWIAIGVGAATFSLAIAAFLNIVIESRSRTRNLKLRQLDEIRNWTMEAYQLLLWLARFAKARQDEAKQRLAILISRSTTILDIAPVFGNDMERVVNDGINLIIDNTKSSPVLTVEEGTNISDSLFDILEEVTKCRSELFVTMKTHTKLADIFSRCFNKIKSKIHKSKPSKV